MNKIKSICFFGALVLVMNLRAQDGGTFTDNRDGHTYRMVTIGSQTWMSENLAYLPRVDLVKDLSWEGSRYWIYGYFGENIEEAIRTEHYKTYGVLYNWSTAMKEACPSGWRLPQETDWRELELFMGMEESELPLRGWRESGSVGKKLKSVSGWYVNSGTGENGFNVLPGGVLGYNEYECKDYSGYFWVGTATSRDNAWIRSVLFSKDGIQRMEERMWFGCSVRCIKEQ